MWLCGLLLVATFTMVHMKVVEREIVTSRKRAFYQTSDVGVSPQGRSSYVFKVKSCNTAIITLSNIKYIEKTKGRYFLFYLGRNFNTQLSLLDSCFGCPPKAVLRRRLLDCNVFKTFWVQWNDLGSVWFGAGHKAGHGMLLSYTTPRPFTIMFSQVTTLESPSTWRFLLDYDVKFLAPAPDGSTTVFLKENVAVASYVYDFKVRPLVNTILTSSNNYFMIFGTQILTKVPLNYESKRVHFLQLRTTEGNVSVTLTVFIEDVNDEVPEIHVVSDIRIPEELPVGTLFSGCFVVSDKDIGDYPKLRLKGADAIYLDVTNHGQLQVKSRIDRDGPNGVTGLDDLILVVEDSSNHTASHHLRVDILDVDDNKPICSPDEVSISISTTMSKQILVCSVKCSDLDVTDGEAFHLKIYDDLDAKNVFIISGADVYIDAEYLRQRFTENTDLTLDLKLVLLAGATGVETTSSFSIIVKVRIERPVVNDYPPYWISPPHLVDGRFFDLEIAETTAMGTIIRCFLAYDRDESPLMYHVASIFTDGGNSANNTFKVDTNSGCLRTASILDADQATGGVRFYHLTISVTDGKYTSSGLCRVFLQNVNDNPPIFSRAVYHVSANFKNQFKRLAEFNVVDFDENTEVSLSLERRYHRFVKLMPSGGRWTLMFRPGIVGLESIPPVIKITAKDNWSTQMSSQVVVIIEGLPCHRNASASRTRNIGSDGELAQSHTKTVLTSDHSTTSLFQTKSTQSGTEMTHSYKTNLERDFQIIQETTQRSSLRLFLLSVCVSLAVFNGLILALLIVILSCRGCSLSKERQKSKEPTESTRKPKRPKMRRTIKIRPRNSGSVVCIVDIHEETRNVKIRKIKINHNNKKASTKTTTKTQNSDLRQTPLNQKDREEIREEINFSSKDRYTRPCSAENQYGKLSKSQHIPEGLESSYYDIESVEVMKTKVHDELSLIQSNPFEANINTIQIPSVDMAHSFTQVETLDYKNDVDCEIFKDDSSSGSDEEFVTDGPVSGDSDNEDNVYNDLRSGDSEESMSDPNCQTPGEIHEEIQSSAAKHCFDVSDTRTCYCSERNSLDISQLFQSSRGVEGSALSSKLFRSLLHQDRESKVYEEDILEVYADFLKAVVVYQGGRVSDVERSIKRFPRRTVHTFTIVYLPRVIFLTFLSQRLNNKQNLDCDIVEIHTRFLHASVVELEKHTLAVCRAKGTIFAMRHVIMTCLCQNCRLTEVSVNFLTQLDKTERQAYRFLDENVVAVIQSKNSFLVFLNKFLNFVESGISAGTCQNGQQGSQYWQPSQTFHSEYVRREMRHVCNVDSVGLNSNPSRDDQYSSLFLSNEHEMKKGSYCFPSYHSTTKGRQMGKTQMISSSYSTDETIRNVVQGHQQMSPGAIPTFPYLYQSSTSMKKPVGINKLQHSIAGDDVKPDTVNTQTKAKRGSRAVKATAAKSKKRKTKVKAWDKDVRDRLYGRVDKGRTDIKKGKKSTET